MKTTTLLIVGLCLCFSIIKCYSIPVQSSNEEFDIIDKKPFEKCPENFILLGEKCYYIELEDKKTRFGSGRSCKEKNSILAKIESEAELNELNKHFLNLTTEESFWISGDDIMDEGIFVWGEEDDVMTYTNWADEEKNDASVNCVQLVQIDDKYLMDVHSCLEARAFICEVASQKTEAEVQQHIEESKIKSNQNDTISEETQASSSQVTQNSIEQKEETTKSSADTECPYGFVQENGKCYYVENFEELNWHAAQRKCQRMGSEILTIENAEKMQFIAKYLKDHIFDRDRWGDSWGKIGFWTGGNDLGSEGEFHWVSTGEELTYSKWYEDEPNNYSDNEHCVEISLMDSVYYMNDHICANEKLFICEAELKEKQRAALKTTKGVSTCEEIELMRLNLEAESRIINLLHSQQQCPKMEF